MVTVLADGLRQESSNSLSASVDWYKTFGSVQTNLLFEGFYTDLSDVFALRKLDQTDSKGNQVLERYNGSGATVVGFTIEGKAVWSSKLQSQIGFTYQRSRYKELEYWSENEDVAPVKRIFRTPDTYGYLTLRYNPTKPLSLAMSGTYTGTMLVQHLEGSGTDIDVAVKTPSFFDFDLKIGYDFKIMKYACLEVNVGMKNIFNSFQKDFDQGELRDSGYIYGPMMPRSLFAGIKFKI